MRQEHSNNDSNGPSLANVRAFALELCACAESVHFDPEALTNFEAKLNSSPYGKEFLMLFVVPAALKIYYEQWEASDSPPSEVQYTELSTLLEFVVNRTQVAAESEPLHISDDVAENAWDQALLISNFLFTRITIQDFGSITDLSYIHAKEVVAAVDYYLDYILYLDTYHPIVSRSLEPIVEAGLSKFVVDGDYSLTVLREGNVISQLVELAKDYASNELEDAIITTAEKAWTCYITINDLQAVYPGEDQEETLERVQDNIGNTFHDSVELLLNLGQSERARQLFLSILQHSCYSGADDDGPEFLTPELKNWRAHSSDALDDVEFDIDDPGIEPALLGLANLDFESAREYIELFLEGFFAELQSAEEVQNPDPLRVLSYLIYHSESVDSIVDCFMNVAENHDCSDLEMELSRYMALPHDGGYLLNEKDFNRLLLFHEKVLEKLDPSD